MNATEMITEIFDDDPFCEAEFWRRMNVETYITNPIAAATGLLMSFIACIPMVNKNVPTDRVPFLFYLAKATVFITGLGTVVFHAVPLSYSAVNIRFLDWIPIVLMGFSATLLALSHDLFFLLNSTEAGVVAVCTCLMIWMITNITMMDSGTRPILTQYFGSDLLVGNILVLLPFLLILIRMLLTPTMREHMLPGGLYLAVSLVMWVVDSSLCRSVSWLSLLHAVYHLTVTMAYLHLIGIQAAYISRGSLKFSMSKYTWPCLCIASKPSQSCMKVDIFGPRITGF